MPSLSSALNIHHIDTTPSNVPMTSAIALSKSSVRIGIWYFGSLPKSENVRDVCLDSLDLIFVTFKTPASRSRAYCDCNPIRAFETFDISKEPISKTSRFWMFWYKRGCNWLGAIKGMALWPRGFSRASLFKTWRKPETAHEKPLAPRVQTNKVDKTKQKKTVLHFVGETTLAVFCRLVDCNVCAINSSYNLWESKPFLK